MPVMAAMNLAALTSSVRLPSTLVSECPGPLARSASSMPARSSSGPAALASAPPPPPQGAAGRLPPAEGRGAQVGPELIHLRQGGRLAQGGGHLAELPLPHRVHRGG